MFGKKMGYLSSRLNNTRSMNLPNLLFGIRASFAWHLMIAMAKFLHLRSHKNDTTNHLDVDKNFYLLLLWIYQIKP